jgi:hypothetical protein
MYPSAVSVLFLAAKQIPLEDKRTEVGMGF